MRKPQHKLKKVKLQRLTDAKSLKLATLKKYSFSMRQMTEKDIEMLVGVLLALLGLGMIFFGIGYAHYLKEIDKTWLHSKARVVSAHIDYSAPSRRSGEPGFYRHTLEYTYTVNGVPYANDKMYYGFGGPRWQSQADAEQSLPKIGEEVAIRVNPKKPAQSAISILHDDVFPWVFFGVVGFLIGALLWVYSRQEDTSS